MDTSATSDINTTAERTNSNNLIKNHSINNKKFKQIWQLGNKHLVIIDKSIIEKLGIRENSTVFLEQEILQDNTILMKIKKF